MKKNFFIWMPTITILSSILTSFIMSLIPELAAEDEMLFFCSICIFFGIFVILWLIKNKLKFVKDYNEYNNLCECTAILELAYNNDYKRYKRQVFNDMILAAIVYFCFLLIVFFLLFAFIYGIILLGFSIFITLKLLRPYLKIRKAGYIELEGRLKDMYPPYKAERDTCTYEEMCASISLPRFYNVINTVNTISAILYIICGMLIFMVGITVINVIGFGNNIQLVLSGGFLVVFAIYAIPIILLGVKSILINRILSSSRFILLTISFVLSVVLSVPLCKPFGIYSAKYLLEDAISSSNFYYDADTNLLQEKLELENLTDFDYDYSKKWEVLDLYSVANDNNDEDFFRMRFLVKVGAEYQIVHNDTLGNERIVVITPDELKEIYNRPKSDLEILVERIKLYYGDRTKVYDDGKYLLIEQSYDKDVPFPTQTEQVSILEDYAKFIKVFMSNDNISTFNRGVKIRCYYDCGKSFGKALTFEELENMKYD